MIPKVFHRIWVGKPMPEHYKKYEDDWLRLNPGWAVRTWGDDDLRWLQNQQLFDDASKYAKPDAIGQFKSDVARYEILYRFGGVYVDCDVEPRKPFESLIDVKGFAGWEQQNQFVGNTVMGSEPGNPFFLAMMDTITGTAKANSGKAATWMTGPRIVTQVYNQWTDKSDLVTYPQEYFFPYSYLDLRTQGEPSLKDYSEAYSVHHWGHQRELRGRPFPVSGNGELSVSIMAHRKREEWVPDLEAQLPGVMTVWDRKNDRWDTGARALTAHDGKSQWHMVVQDDALLPPDFLAGVKRMLDYVPPSHPVGLYYGQVRPRRQETYGLSRQAQRQKAPFIVHNGPWWGVGIVIPTAHTKDIVNWGDKNLHIPNYDRRIARWYGQQGIPCYYTVPSLIEHRHGEENPSLIAGRTGQNRRAWRFVGPRSALEVDWSGPVVRGGM